MSKRILSKIWAAISAFPALVFGRAVWSSPPWLNYLQHKAVEKPRMFWSACLGLLLLLAGAVYGYCWYKNRPEPQWVTAVITAPEITPLAEKLVPNVLTIDFGLKNKILTPQSVAPLRNVGKEVTKGVELIPAMAGKWKWESDSRLIFVPAKDWPAGQTYRVRFTQDFFTAKTRMKSLEDSFSTRPFAISVSEFKFYQDPINQDRREAVAVMHFNYPVDTGSLEQKTSLAFQRLQQNTAAPFKFTVTYDAFKRTAWLHSQNLTLPPTPRYLLLTIAKGVRAAGESTGTPAALTRNLLIPDAESYFRVTAATAAIVRNNQDRPEQVINVETTVGVTEAEMNQSLHVYQLPKNYPASATEAEKKDYQWSNPGEVSSSILALAKPVHLEPIPAEHNYSTLHSYKIAVKGPGFLYLKLDKGAKGFAGYTLNNNYAAVLKTPELPQEISFLHKGALLALSGEKKLSAVVRGLAAVKFEIARVMPGNVNQLITQTGGDFNNPFFLNQTFNQQNISEIFSEIQQFDTSDPSRQQYTALDLERYLSTATATNGPRGLFLLQATGWDLEKKTPLDIKSNRLVLITDLGLIVKDNQDGSHDFYVQSIAQGKPIAGATVSVLGKNGLPLLSRISDEQGHVSFPRLSDFTDEREPAVYLASINSDVSFIPFNRFDRQLNLTRFDIGGIYSSNQELHSLSAYLFTDRGIYRPSDEVHVGMVVKQAYAQLQPPGLPLQLTVVDPRGITIRDEKLTLDSSGYLTTDFTTSAVSPTGQYSINLYIVKDNHEQSLLGTTSIRIAEFQPDRMRITSSLSQSQTKGWISPEGLTASIDLSNLYGTPATDRLVSGRILLSPQSVHFDEYPDYIFADPLRDPARPAKVFTETLKDERTDEKGQAHFDLSLQRFEKATYKLTFYAEGFEAEGGRSVATQSTALISPLPWLAGFKADGDLHYINRNAQRSVNLIAVNPQLQQEAITDLTMELVSLQPVSTLVKKTDGTYQYQSIIKSTKIKTEPFAISDKGNNLSLPTSETGDFAIIILDKNQLQLSRIAFSVVGESQRPLAKNAELSIKLNKETYKAGDDIELQITAPYTGSGLITLERDRVYAAQWFNSETSSSVQKIHIPADFQGNGYVNVVFVRNWNSPEIFISPLSFGIAAFDVSHENHVMQLDLTVPELARPGENLTIKYQSDRPGKIIVFAVDEGILQVTNYLTPNPLAYFFQKRALEVITQQTLDQILPKFIRERELSAAGGDGGEELLANHLNPFKRKTDLPVVFWSGLLDTDRTTRQVVYPVPDYFNGSLRVMAVAVADNEAGVAEKKTLVRGDFIINPNVPAFAAPGDQFEITAGIASNLQGNNGDTSVTVDLDVPPELEILGAASQSLLIKDKAEKTVRFNLRAKAALGSTRLNFTAWSGSKSSAMAATLSIRPPTPFVTTVNSGSTKDASLSLLLNRVLYPEYRSVNVAVSNSPLILVSGLQHYLDNFPYGCTEQITSKGWPLLVMAGQTWFAADAESIRARVTAVIQMLGQRQTTAGNFSYWPGYGENSADDFASVYAMHFLTEAKAQSYAIPNDMFFYGMDYLKTLAAQNNSDLAKARLQAYAIYVLTRNEIVTTDYVTNLQLNLDKYHCGSWRKDITGSYIAAVWQLLKNASEAQRLMAEYQTPVKTSEVSDFHSPALADAQYFYLIARHFPEKLPEVSNRLLPSLTNSLNTGELNTILSGYTTMALGAYTQNEQFSVPGNYQLVEVDQNDSKKTVNLSNVYEKIKLDVGIKKIIINNPDSHSFFYQLTQAGFDKNLPASALSNGIEIYREYRDSEGKVVESLERGKEAEVHIQVRALNNHFLSNIAIVDLLPGGFEVVRNSVTMETMDYADIREDRVLFFGPLQPEVTELVYRIKAVNIGRYTVPPAFAESMYNPGLQARSLAGSIVVTDR